MENSAKVLLLAGAILLAILLISLGMLIVNMGSSSIDTNELDSMEIVKFNKKYEMYEGIVYGKAVKTILLYAVNDNKSITTLDSDAYKYSSTIDICVNIRSNSADLLDKFKDNAEMIRALNGTRNYGVRYVENIEKISSAIVPGRKYKIWYSYSQNGYIWEIHIDEP